MKLYTFYSPSHAVLYERYFRPSLKDDFDVVVKVVPEQICQKGGEYFAPGWRETMLIKVDMILGAITEQPGEMFLFADADVQFFEPVVPLVTAAMAGVDAAFQRDHPSGTRCAGFFACRGTPAALDLWQTTRRTVLENRQFDDQIALNWLLDRAMVDVKWTLLPDCFLSGGTIDADRGQWQPGKRLTVPDDIVAHHANWTVGVPNKIAQLDYVRQIVAARRDRVVAPQGRSTS